MTANSLSLRARLLLLVVTSILPLLGFSLVSQYRAYNDTIERASERGLARARSMASDVEEEFGKHIAIMEVMSLSPTLRSGDLVGMERGLARLAREKIPGASFALLRPDGERLFDTALPPGAPLPVRRNLEASGRAIQTGGAAVSDLYLGVAQGLPGIAIDIPVKREDGSVAYVLSFRPPPNAFEQVIRRQQLPAGWLVAVLDRQGVIVARTPNPDQFVSQRPTSDFLQHLTTKREGVVEMTSLEGVLTLASFAHVGRFGWSVAIGVPKTELTKPAFDTVIRTLAIAGSLLLCSIALALVVARGISRPIGALGQLVTGGANMEVLRDPPSTGLREVDEVVQAFRTGDERRHLAERRIRQQLQHLSLLHRITRAIGERQDLDSIFQVVVRSVEDQLPLDFCCLCLYDRTDQTLTVSRVGLESGALALELALSEHTRFKVDGNGLSRCVRGELVYEPDIARVEFPFARRLAGGGLRSLVASPLRVGDEVIGVLLAARVRPEGFSSVECEFLLQLCEHTALAAHQAQLRDALQAAYDDLRQTQQAMMQQDRLRAMGQMASGIAHDINNALSPVALYTESLLEREPGLSPRAREYLETIQRAVDDVARTVARMRDFYRQREPQQAFVPVQLNHLVRQVVDLTRPRWSDMAQRGGAVVEVRTELAADLPEISGVESDIREALTNLILNGVDAMPGGGVLTLRTRMADPARGPVVVEVADNGVGMDEETRRRCLEPFFTTKGERGTGLGLAMVHGVARRHDAEIDIESLPGESTTIRLAFPLPPPGAAAVRPEVPRAVLRPLRLLTVDDDPLLQKSLRDALESDGHVVIAASGGEAGVAAFREALERGEGVDAVITDLGMPKMDGRKVAAAIKGASRDTPVIMLTGWGQRLVTEGDVPPHVDRVLSKPPKMRDLRAALADLCRPSAD